MRSVSPEVASAAKTWAAIRLRIGNLSPSLGQKKNGSTISLISFSLAQFISVDIFAIYFAHSSARGLI